MSMKTLLTFAFLASMVSSAAGFSDISSLFESLGIGGVGSSTYVGCELVCQGHDYTEATCNGMTGCEFDAGKCWSAVGQNDCATAPRKCKIKCDDVSSQPDMSCSGSEPYEFILVEDPLSVEGTIFKEQCELKSECRLDSYSSWMVSPDENRHGLDQQYHICMASDYARSSAIDCESSLEQQKCREVGSLHSKILYEIEMCKKLNCSAMTVTGKGWETLIRESSVMTFPDTLVELTLDGVPLTDFLPRDDSRWSDSIKILRLIASGTSASDMIFSESGVWPPALTSLQITQFRISNPDLYGSARSGFQGVYGWQGVKVPASTKFPDSLQYIDLTGNFLTIVCKVWPANLKGLDLKDNSLTQITTSNTVLPDTLVMLDLSHNKLTLIDSDLVWPTSLKELYLHRNKLASFECNMDTLLGSLVKIDLFDNELTSLSAGMVLPDSLAKLDVHNNALTVIDDNLAWSSGLELLDMSRNKLKIFGGQISNLASLKILLLFNNDLTDIPAVWPGALDQIDLRSNNLEDLRATVWPGNLTVLDISVNKLKELSENTTWPDKLLYLDLGTNLLAHLPARMAWPGTLKWLSLTNNVLEDLSKTMTWPQPLLELFLDKNKLREMPEVAWPTFLLKLDLSFNGLTKLPEMPWPTFLESMILDHNKIQKLPDVAFPALLKRLSLSHNAFEIVPKQLKVLDVSSNNTMIYCQSYCLSEGRLDLSYNSISTNNDTAAFNDAMAGQSWTQLDLSNNAITNVAGIIWPEQLEVLDLSSNGIRELPPVDNQSWPSGLTHLILDNNSWETLMDTAACLQLSSKDLIDHPNCKHVSNDASPDPVRVTTGATVLPFLDLRLPSDQPCGVSTVDFDKSTPPAERKRYAREDFVFDDDMLNDRLKDMDDKLKEMADMMAKFEAMQEFDLKQSQVLLSASHANWDCKQVDAKSPAPAPALAPAPPACECSCHGFEYVPDERNNPVNDCWILDIGNDKPCCAPDPTPGVCTLNCKFTEEGSTFISAKQVSRDAAIGIVDQQYKVVWASGIPVTVVTTLAVGYFSNYGTKPEKKWMAWLKLGGFFFAAVDMMTDWAFYALELSSPGFEALYTCNATEQDASVNYECTVNGEPSSFSCNSYGQLHGKCGFLQKDEATNECECHDDLECSEKTFAQQDGLCKKKSENFFDATGVLAQQYISLPNLNPGYLACWLKMDLTDSDETQPEPQENYGQWIAADCRDGLKCTYKYDASYGGIHTRNPEYSGSHITRDFNVRATTLEECAGICLADDECDHFDYYNQPGCFARSNCLDKLVNPYYGYNCGAGEFEDLDNNVDETCGFLSPNDGTNECECHADGVCKEVEGSRGSCAVDGTDNDHEALLRACLVCNIVATILWFFHLVNFVLLAKSDTAAAAKAKAKAAADGDDVDDDDSGESDTKCLKKVNTTLLIITMLVEDGPQLFFAITYIRYMGILDPEKSETIAPSAKTLVIISFVLSALSILKVIITCALRLRKSCSSDEMNKPTPEVSPEAIDPISKLDLKPQTTSNPAYIEIG